MKTIHKLSLLLVGLFVFTGCTAGRSVTTQNIPQKNRDVTMDLFYQSLSPYGQWINYGSYGNAWVPGVTGNFRPYATNGRWVYSNYGWTWISGYRWGWAPFHYGRWTHDGHYGWIWIPGKVWAPAWVAWRQSSAYYGWAPLGPRMNINIQVNLGPQYWNFVPAKYITSRNIRRYYIPQRKTVHIIHNTTIINNVYEQNNHRYFSGPTRRAVQQRTNQNIQPVRVFNSDRPANSSLTSNRLRIYRPTISREQQDNSTKSHRPRPVTVSRDARRSTTTQKKNRKTAPDQRRAVPPKEREQSRTRTKRRTPNQNTQQHRAQRQKQPTTRRSTRKANRQSSRSKGSIRKNTAPRQQSSRSTTQRRSQKAPSRTTRSIRR